MEERKSVEQEPGNNPEKTTVIPVVQEQVRIEKKQVDTARITVRKEVTEEKATVEVPLVSEGYRIEHVKRNEIVDEMPQVRQDGDLTVIPVVREVLVVEKRFELIEEIHITKEKSSVTHKQEVTLKKEQVHIERNPIQRDDQR